MQWDLQFHNEMKELLKDDCLSYSTVKTWVWRFKTGHFDVTDKCRSRRPNSVTTDVNVYDVHDNIVKYRRISVKIVAENMGISRERVYHVINRILGMRMSTAKCVPNVRMWIRRALECQYLKLGYTILQLERCFFLPHLDTMDEIWIHFYDPLNIQHSMKRRHSGSQHPKYFRTQSDGKVMAPLFWDKAGRVLIKHMPEGGCINAGYHMSFLE